MLSLALPAAPACAGCSGRPCGHWPSQPGSTEKASVLNSLGKHVCVGDCGLAQRVPAGLCSPLGPGHPLAEELGGVKDDEVGVMAVFLGDWRNQGTKQEKKNPEM